MHLTLYLNPFRSVFVQTLCIVAFLLRFTSSVYAGENRWTATGPDGGDVSVLAVDPQTPTTIYAGTNGSGSFKSTNGGETWDTTNTGIDSPYINVLVLDPTTPQTLYAGTSSGVFKSTNGGAHWTIAERGFPRDFYGGVAALAIAQTAPNVLYAGTESQGLFKSTDSGATWTPITSPTLTASTVHSIAIDPRNPQTVYLGGYFDSQCGGPCRAPIAFKSIDGGANWQQINFDIPTPIAFSFRFLFGAGGSIYAYNFGSIIKSIDGGAHWVLVTNNFPDDQFTSFALSPTQPLTLVAGTSRGVFRSGDDGHTWQALNPTLGQINTIALPSSLPTTLLVGTSVGVSKSDDNGTTWLAKNTGIRGPLATNLILDPIFPSILYTNWQVPLISHDQGETWAEFLTLPSGQPLNLLAVAPTTPLTFYAIAPSTDNRPLTLLKSTNEGMMWVPILTDLFILQFLVDPVVPTTLYANTAQQSPEAGFQQRLLKSTDGGATWVPLTDTPISSLTIDPRPPSIVYAVTRYGLFQSTDGGSSWRLLSSAVVSGTITLDPQTPTTMYTYGSGTPDQFLKSTDGGVTWTPLRDGLATLGLPEFITLTTFAIDPHSPSTLYLGINGEGVFRSVDAGKSWAALNGGLFNKNVQDFTIDPTTGQILYASTFGGVFKYSIGNQSADLAITQSDSPDPVLTGENLTYTSTVTNNGPASASDVTTRTPLPQDMTLVSATPSQGSCTGQSTVRCKLGTIAAGKNATLTLVVKPRISGATGVVTNIVTVSGNETDPRTDNNAASIVTTVNAAPGPDLTVFWNSLQEKCKGNEDQQQCTLKGSLTVYNVGVQVAPASTVMLWHYSGRFSFEIGRLNVPTIKAGKKKKLKFKYVLAPRVSLRGLEIIVTIDPDNKIVEMNEQNNSATSVPIP